jgi:hypothetical protein
MHGGITDVPAVMEERELKPRAGEGHILPSRRLGRPDERDAKSVHRIRSKVDVFYRQEGFTVPLHEALDTMLWVDDSVALYSSGIKLYNFLNILCRTLIYSNCPSSASSIYCRIHLATFSTL